MIRLILTLIFLSLMAGCDPKTPEKETQSTAPLQIVVTTSMVADLVQQVAGPDAQVAALLGQGVDPHLYRPTASDVGRMMQADVLFYSGLMLEGAMQTAFERAAQKGKTVVAVTDQLPRELLRFPGGTTGHPDPHVWNDPGIWRKCLNRIVNVLSEKDPAHAAQYASRAETYGRHLTELDDYCRAAVATIPPENRYLVTAHDAFGYFSHAYGLEEHSVQGISTESEPGVQDINQLVDFLVSKKIPALFIEATVNSDSLNAVMERAKQRGWEVRQGGLLYSDSMGAPGTAAGTYPGMIEHNLKTIVQALNGTLPSVGFKAATGPAQE